MANATTKTTPKSAIKRSRTVTLYLPSKSLSRFPSDSPAAPPVRQQAIATTKHDASPAIQLPDSADKSSDSNATPNPAAAADDEIDPNSLAPPKEDNKKKRGGAVAAGRKRAPPSIDPNAPPRERGRPGPKKKPRLPDGTIDRSGEKGATSTTTVPAHKLGPKANTGAINAGLRALDRSGKPCRKWAKKGLHLKSFTGTNWSMSSWKAPQKDTAFPGDVKSDSTGSSEVKPVHDSSAVPSERSHSHLDGDTTMMTGIESSPAPPIAA